MNPNSANRIVTGVSLFLFVFLSVFLGLLVREPKKDPRKRPSTFFTDPSGAKALLLVMQRTVPSAQQWRRPLSLLPDPDPPGNPTSLLVAGPQRALTENELSRLRSWIAAGGQLLLFTADGWPILPRDAKQASSPGTGGKTVLGQFGVRFGSTGPAEPGWLRVAAPSRAEEALNVYGGATTNWQGNFDVLARSGDKVMAIAIPHGKGRLVAVPDPGFVSNQALRQGDNAVWLADICSAWSNGSVLFDEYHQGFGQTRGALALTAAFLKTPWGWAVLQLLFAGMLYAFLFRRRMGRIYDPPPPPPRSPFHLIEARAGLFRAARAGRLAVDLIRQQVLADFGPQPPAGWGEFVQAQKRRHASGPVAELLSELEERRLAFERAPGNISESQLLEWAQTAGRIQQLAKSASTASRRIS